MVGNYIVGIRQMSLLVVVHLLSRCHQGKNDNYGVSDSSQQGKQWKLWCLRLFLCTLIIFARVQQSDRESYFKWKYIVMGMYQFNKCSNFYYYGNNYDLQQTYTKLTRYVCVASDI